MDFGGGDGLREAQPNSITPETVAMRLVSASVLNSGKRRNHAKAVEAIEKKIFNVTRSRSMKALILGMRVITKPSVI
jgi:hypothetical protein